MLTMGVRDPKALRTDDVMVDGCVDCVVMTGSLDSGTISLLPPASLSLASGATVGDLGVSQGIGCPSAGGNSTDASRTSAALR